MELHGNLIDGQWVERKAAPNVNPANIAEVVGYYARATTGDAAIAAAKAAFPGWSRSWPADAHALSANPNKDQPGFGKPRSR